MDTFKTFESLDRFLDLRLKTWNGKAKERKFSFPSGPVVALSREPGCDVGSVASLLAARMGLDVYGRKIVEQIAGVTHKSEEVVSRLDEKSRSRLKEWITTSQDMRGLSALGYLKGLKKVLYSIAAHGKAVVIGRGGCFLLPPEKRIALRMVAPFGMRLKSVMRNLQLPEKQAREHIAQAERERRLYVKRYFKAEIADPTHYDAVINLGSVPPEAVPDIVKVLLDNYLGKGI